MNKGITQSIRDALAANAPKAMSGAEVIASIGRSDVTAGTVRTLLGQRSKPMGKLPALWRKVGHDSYAA